MMIQTDIQTIIIIALVAFIVGIFVGVILTRPRYPYRARSGYRRYDND